MNSVIANAKEKMFKAVENTKKEFSLIRSGRANPKMLDGIKVSYYGTMTPINQMATVSSPEPRLIVVSPWDASQLKEIEKAIQGADLGINPQSDGRVIRIPIPKLTEERRKELVKMAKDKAEAGRVAIRNIRRQANDELKKLEKKSDITEDDLKKGETEVQKLTDKFSKEIDTLMGDKEKDLMSV